MKSKCFIFVLLLLLTMATYRNYLYRKEIDEAMHYLSKISQMVDDVALRITPTMEKIDELKMINPVSMKGRKGKYVQ